ncbi:unnamed protein product, partial [Oppiella nova]
MTKLIADFLNMGDVLTPEDISIISATNISQK